MKKLIIKLGIGIGIIALLFILLNTITIAREDPEAVAARTRFPNNIFNVYYVDKIQIENPIVGYLQGGYYVFTDNVLKEYTGNDSLFLARRDVLQFFDSAHTDGDYQKTIYDFGESLDGQDILCFRDTVSGIPIFNFYFEPTDFILILHNKVTWICVDEPDVYDIEFPKDYIPSVFPRFTKKQNREMMKIRKDELGADDDPAAQKQPEN